MGTDLSKPFIGQTDSGLSYIGYSFKSGMQFGYMFERYLYRLEITEDLYADEGISGTKVKKRPQFKKMIDDCLAGKIDYIITKSVSRFARNTVECLDYISVSKIG